MKLGKIVVYMDNYNFTNFHQNQMKNKKVRTNVHPSLLRKKASTNTFSWFLFADIPTIGGWISPMYARLMEVLMSAKYHHFHQRLWWHFSMSKVKNLWLLIFFYIPTYKHQKPFNCLFLIFVLFLLIWEYYNY